MNNVQAKAYVVDYLEERNIFFMHHKSDNSLTIALTGHENCPRELLESSFYFCHTACIEARVYFDESFSNCLTERQNAWPRLYRLLNYINARYWRFNHDWVGGRFYSPSCFITPRFCLTEGGDRRDLMAIMLIDYDIFEMAPLEVCDYITAILPAYINKDLAIPIQGVLLECMSTEHAISMIEDGL